MIRVRLIFDTEGWAYHRRALILQEYAPSDMAITIGPHRNRFDEDCALLVDFNYGHCSDVRIQLERRGHRDTLLLSSFNRGWPERRDYFDMVLRHAHAVLINNRECWERSGSLPGTYTISNGVDRRVFTCQVPIEKRLNRVLWIGSEYHRGTKNYDLLCGLRDRLGGDAECDFRLVDPYSTLRTHEEMAAWYNTGVVYVVASKTEGTPNPALEAAACGCVLVTTKVGNMPELVRDGQNGIFVEPTVDSLTAGVRAALEQREALSVAMLQDIAPWDWKVRAEEFYGLFRRLLSGEAPLRRKLGSA